jgi:hypothetical protein
VKHSSSTSSFSAHKPPVTHRYSSSMSK